MLYTITHLILQIWLELIIPISRERKLMLRGLEQNAPVVELPESKIHALYIISVFIYLRWESRDFFSFKKNGGRGAVKKNKNIFK